jgi:hypothetical protein
VNIRQEYIDAMRLYQEANDREKALYDAAGDLFIVPLSLVWKPPSRLLVTYSRD